MSRKFEAGAPDIRRTIGLVATIRYLKALGMESVKNHERELTENPKGFRNLYTFFS